MQVFLMILMLLLNLPTVYLGLVMLNTLKVRKPYPKSKPGTRFAIVVPARNEAGVVGNLIQSLKRQNYPRELLDIYVVPNNCTDDTAGVALREGAKLLTCEGEIKCKGDVLHQAFAQLLPMEYDAYAVFDADNVVEPDFMRYINDALMAGETVARGRIKAGNPLESWIAGGYGLYQASTDWAYSRPHTECGFSANLVGTAFAFKRNVLEEMGGWNTTTICEDMEFAAQCVKRGHRVAWVPEAVCYEEEPNSFAVSMRQRRRWCSGVVETARLEFSNMWSKSLPDRRVGRDLGMLFVTAHTQPIAFLLTLVSIPVFGIQMLIMSAASLVLSYLGIVALGILLCFLGGYPVGKMGATVVMFPVFMVSWMPLQFMALVKPVRKWHAIAHNGQSPLDPEPVEAKVEEKAVVEKVA